MKKAILLLALLLPILSNAQRFEEIDIPMRDGKSLAADLYVPIATKTYSTILIQTPYNKNLQRLLPIPLTQSYDIDKSDYVIVVVDWRCRFASSDACGGSNTKGEDGYDIVEWIATQPWSNGKVGTLGASALGVVQYETAREQPPHLICASPEVAAPYYHYDHYFPGGVYRTEYLETLDELFPGFGSNLIITNPFYNNVWQIAENSTMYPEDIAIPMLVVAGWFDINSEDNFGMLDTLLSASDPLVRNDHKIIIGPWVHGGLSFFGQETGEQGQLNFPEAKHANTNVQKQFFDYYLLDDNNGWENRKTFSYFQMGDNQWKQSHVWPESTAIETFYLNQNGDLQLTTNNSISSSSFVYDPDDPSPTIGGKTLSKDLDQGPFDQELVENRSDNLIFTSALLPNNLALNGSVKVQLKVSSDRQDTDFAIRLTDVFPDGRSILIGEGIQRMRYREGNMKEDISFMEIGESYEISISLDQLAYTFLAGHRIRLTVTSSNYPRFNRNMNNGDEDQYPNSTSDVVFNPIIATNTIHFEDGISRIEIPISNSITSVDDNSSMANLITFPNPALNEINLQYSNKINTLELLDLKGIVIKKIPPTKKSIDVSYLSSGVYFIRIKSENQIEMAKFVKI